MQDAYLHLCDEEVARIKNRQGRSHRGLRCELARGAARTRADADRGWPHPRC